jgi:hypothetical protein
MVAVSWLELTNVVGQPAPNATMLFGVKPLPFTVRKRLGVPAEIEMGLTDVTIGTTKNGKKLPETTPPGLETVILTATVAVTKFALTEARNEVALEYVVGRVAPFHRTTDPLTNPVPITSSVKPGPPRGTVFDAVERTSAEDTVAGAADVIENEAPAEVAPPLNTVMVEVPTAVIRLLLTVAAN